MTLSVQLVQNIWFDPQRKKNKAIFLKNSGHLPNLAIILSLGQLFAGFDWLLVLLKSKTSLSAQLLSQCRDENKVVHPISSHANASIHMSDPHLTDFALQVAENSFFVCLKMPFR